MYGPPRLHPFRPSPSHHVPPGPSGTLQPSEGGFDRFQSGRSRSRVIFGEDPHFKQENSKNCHKFEIFEAEPDDEGTIKVRSSWDERTCSLEVISKFLIVLLLGEYT